MFKRLSILLVVFYCYTFIRYHIGNNVPFSEWLFILNKTLAWFSFTVIGLSIFPKNWFKSKNLTRKNVGIIGFIFANLHILLNLFLISFERYPLLYKDKISFSNLGITIISLGVFSFICFLLTFFASIKKLPKYYLKLGFIGFVAILFHPLLLGFQKWFHIQKWPLYMPPITLLAVLTGLFFLIYRKNTKN